MDILDPLSPFDEYVPAGNTTTPPSSSSNTQPQGDQTPITPQTPSVNFTELIGLQDTHSEIENPEAAQQKLASLYNQEEFSDIVFTIGRKRFYAIKALVVGWSPVFKSMLCGDFMEAGLKEVPLDDVDPVAFEMFLRVIYSGKSGLYPVHNFVDLYAFANRFEIPEIEKLCLEKHCMNQVYLSMFFRLLMLVRGIAIWTKLNKLEEM
ncbi:hypothetical protein C9374_003641 [Naegleria lovaniensis]|uniref:BTB domain-containing protein n=1 Tax=Naegleria lovaniensis TaxID=51637 RepID=A0AA88KS76_NAELO|nr:uncharacterized protein C9374_003641 [Naegleria lovaniensis]KAG2393877.1 hypothetical protein C9374_003641 [Naegleria lovaniensis]